MYDLVIIGSGPGGAVLAKELTRLSPQLKVAAIDGLSRGQTKVCGGLLSPDSKKALSSLDIESLSNKEFTNSRDTYFWCELYDENDTLLARNTELGTKPKHFEFLKPNIKIDAKECKDGVEILISSDVFAKNNEISFKNYDIVLSDNYFDLTDNKEYRVVAKTSLSANEILNNIKIVSVYDISK